MVYVVICFLHEFYFSIEVDQVLMCILCFSFPIMALRLSFCRMLVFMHNRRIAIQGPIPAPTYVTVEFLTWRGINCLTPLQLWMGFWLRLTNLPSTLQLKLYKRWPMCIMRSPNQQLPKLILIRLFLGFSYILEANLYVDHSLQYVEVQGSKNPHVEFAKFYGRMLVLARGFRNEL